MATRKQTHYRSSESGQFTTKREADRKPAEHEREVIRHPAPKR